jgi:NAD(P)-dependent dehydrogenase (short-subunit alcohol dehydrogenase family)
MNLATRGPTETPMLQRIFDTSDKKEAQFTSTYANIPLKRMGKPEEIAQLCTFLLSDESSFMTGVICPCDGGLMA